MRPVQQELQAANERAERSQQQVHQLQEQVIQILNTCKEPPILNVSILWTHPLLGMGLVHNYAYGTRTPYLFIGSWQYITPQYTLSPPYSRDIGRCFELEVHCRCVCVCKNFSSLIFINFYTHLFSLILQGQNFLFPTWANLLKL